MGALATITVEMGAGLVELSIICAVWKEVSI